MGGTHEELVWNGCRGSVRGDEKQLGMTAVVVASHQCDCTLRDGENGTFSVLHTIPQREKNSLK